MDLQGKRLLLMGGGAYFEHIKEYAKEAGFITIAIGKNTESFKYADEIYQVDTQDVDRVVELVKTKDIDGIFVGASEINIPPAIEVCRRTGLFFYATEEQWNIFSNKALFKALAQESGVPVIPEYNINKDYTKEDIEKLAFPVMIKPADSSGAHGLNVCYRLEDFEKYYDEARKWSPSQTVVVEELITDAEEVFFQYTIQDGEVSLSSAFTKVYTSNRKKYYTFPLFHMYPSKYISEYYKTFHEAVTVFMHKLGVSNGCMTFQSFYKDGKFYVFEAGFRLGGSQNYILTEYENGANSLRYMINYALTGRMSDQRILDVDNPMFMYPCCNYYVGLNPGTIAVMDGVDTVKKLPGVLNVTVMAKVGDTILDTNANDRVCLRIHVVGSDERDLAKNIEHIYSSLHIISTTGDDMIMEKIDLEKCYSMIQSSIKIDQ